MIEITNFDNLDEAAKVALAQLLTEDDSKKFWSSGQHNELKLGFRIIRHFNSDKPREGVSTPRVRYEVMDNQLFNEGGYGKYYRCRYTLSLDDEGKLVVKKRKEGRIRLVKEQIIKREGHLDLMRNEADAMHHSDVLHRSQNKPEIFHVKPLVEVENKTYMIMKELPGVQLFTLLEENDLTLQERFNLTVALLKALKAQIHDFGYIHRDIKPENILVYKKGSQFEIYIIDFGFIKKSSFNDMQDSMGTPPYAAPECYGLTENKNEKTDIYALGRTLMFLWGYRQLKRDASRTPCDEACNPYFDNLFLKLDEKPGCHQELRAIFEKMCHQQMNMRPDIPDILISLNKLSDRLNPVKSIDVFESELRIFKLDEEEEDAYAKYCGI